MLFLHGYMDGITDSVGAALQACFAGEYRVAVHEIADLKVDKAMSVVNEIIAEERPQIIVGVGRDSYVAMHGDWDDDVDVIVVNPSLGKGLDEIPIWKFSNIFVLYSTRGEYHGETYIHTLRTNYPGLHLIGTKAFGKDLNKAGIQRLISLIKRVGRYRGQWIDLMTYAEFEKMVRNRPKPDMPSYYRLIVYSYDTRTAYARETVNDAPAFRRSISCRQAQFATKNKALSAMHDFVASEKEDLCMFKLERLPFGVFESKPFWLEAWTYDSNGNLLQEASCSGAHYRKAGIFGKFFGHLPEKIKWHEGDIVQILHSYFGDIKTYVALGIVAEPPKDTHEGYDNYIYAAKQWIKEGNNPKKWEKMVDYEGSDEDEMFIQFGPYNEDWSNFTFDSPMMVLPAPENLPDEVKAELRSWHADWLRHIGK